MLVLWPFSVARCTHLSINLLIILEYLPTQAGRIIMTSRAGADSYQMGHGHGYKDQRQNSYNLNLNTNQLPNRPNPCSGATHPRLCWLSQCKVQELVWLQPPAQHQSIASALNRTHQVHKWPENAVTGAAPILAFAVSARRPNFASIHSESHKPQRLGYQASGTRFTTCWKYNHRHRRPVDQGVHPNHTHRHRTHMENQVK